jgi:hypothetical protein
MSTRMQQRRGTAAQWVSTNNGNGPILAAGEIGYESDTNKFKIGDGVNHWIDLPAFIDEAALGGSLGDYVPLSDLAQPLGVATLDGSGKLLSSQIPNIDEISQDAINSALTAGNGISKDYNDSANTITIGLSHDVEIAGTLTLSQAPTTDLQAATKLYVDNVAAGINFHEAVKAATVAPLSATYNNGTNGVGATLINSGTKSTLEIDGVTLSADDRVLVKDQADAKQNGVYVVSVVGSPLVNWELVRASDADNSPAGEFKAGDFNLVIAGTANAGYGFVNTAAGAITVGTTEITYAPFSAGKTVVAGTGLWETSPGVLAIDNTVATLEDAQTFKNKGINFADNTVSATLAQLNTAVTDANLATIAGTESLQNKTLLSPTIETATIDGATITGGSIDVPSLKLSGTDVATSSDLSTHASDTTNVHGIANTADLATTTYVDTAVGNIDLTPYATLDGIQTLTNKTLANPTITAGAGIQVVGTISGFEISTYPISAGVTGLSFYKFPLTNSIGLQVGDQVQAYKAGETELNSKVWTVTSIDTGFGGIEASINETYSYNNNGFGNTGFDLNKVTSSSVTISGTEISYLDGVTSGIQGQLDGKSATTHGHVAADVSDFTEAAQDAIGNSLGSGLSYTDSTGEIFVDATVVQTRVANVSDTEIGYLDGVTSGIQAQIDAKAPLASPSLTGTTSVDNLEISGTLTFTGTATEISSTTTVLADPLIYLADGNTGNIVDLGFVGNFNDGTYQHSGLARDASDGKWKLFSGVVDEPTNTINFTGATYDTLKVGVLEGSAALTGTPTAPTASPLTSTTQIATTEYVQEDNKVNYVSVSGTSLTLSKATHLFSTVHCTSSSAVTVSIPTDASDNWPVGTYVNIRQMGTGQITVAAATPATTTVVATDSQFKTRVQYSELVVEKIAANTWIVVGDTAA